MPGIVAVIPARMGSSRFPGKPLAPLLGRTMLEHVFRRTELCRHLDAVYVATCDEEIQLAVEGFGGQALMTSSRHERASDRVAEAAQNLSADVIVMIQGDEPMTRPEMIEAAIRPLSEDADVNCVNLVKRIDNPGELSDPNTIKVVMDQQKDALYFSREPIPTQRLLDWNRLPLFKQVCTIPFRRELLLRFAELAPTPLEQAESIDMLRLLEHGYRVRLEESHYESQAVDTREDLERVERLMSNDPLVERYSTRA